MSGVASSPGDSLDPSTEEDRNPITENQ
jgi:hypothetical protein